MRDGPGSPTWGNANDHAPRTFDQTRGQVPRELDEVELFDRFIERLGGCPCKVVEIAREAAATIAGQLL